MFLLCVIFLEKVGGLWSVETVESTLQRVLYFAENAEQKLQWIKDTAVNVVQRWQKE